MGNNTVEEKLDDLLKESSEQSRHQIIFFIGFIFYILASLSSITDKLLFIPDSLFKLPIISLELPVLISFWVIPFLLVFFHGYLLITFLEHRQLLKRWETNNNSNLAKSLVFPFFFNYFIKLETSQVTVVILKISLAFIAYIAPLFTLLAIQIRFSCYQSLEMTYFHFFALLLDSLLLMIYWFRITEPNLDSKLEQWCEIIRYQFEEGHFKILGWIYQFLTNNCQLLYKYRNTVKIKFKFRWGLVFVLWLFLGVSLGNIYSLREILKLKITQKDIQEFRNEFITYVREVNKFLSENCYFFGAINLKSFDSLIQIIYPHLILREEILIKTSPDPSIVQEYLSKMGLEKAKEAKARALVDFATGLDLKGRSLILAELEGCKLISADLRNAHLDNAFLESVDLRNAKMVSSTLQNAYLGGAQLQNANLLRAQLQNANLLRAQLQYADLKGAELQYADLYNAKLQNADLYKAQLQNAYLGGAQLQNAKLVRAQLQNAYLINAQLQNANLERAQLQNANLEFACLHNAKLVKAELQNANLLGAELQNAKLGGAELQNANLLEAQLQSADLEFAILKGVLFFNTAIWGAKSKGIKLDGSLGLKTLSSSKANWEDIIKNWDLLEESVKIGTDNDIKIWKEGKDELNKAKAEIGEFPNEFKIAQDDRKKFENLWQLSACKDEDNAAVKFYYLSEKFGIGKRLSMEKEFKAIGKAIIEYMKKDPKGRIILEQVRKRKKIWELNFNFEDEIAKFEK